MWCFGHSLCEEAGGRWRFRKNRCLGSRKTGQPTGPGPQGAEQSCGEHPTQRQDLAPGHFTMSPGGHLPWWPFQVSHLRRAPCAPLPKLRPFVGCARTLCWSSGQGPLCSEGEREVGFWLGCATIDPLSLRLLVLGMPMPVQASTQGQCRGQGFELWCTSTHHSKISWDMPCCACLAAAFQNSVARVSCPDVGKDGSCWAGQPRAIKLAAGQMLPATPVAENFYLP